jgi:hypothetical protein
MSTRGCLLIVAIVLCPVLMGCASVPRTPPIDIRFTVVKPSLDLSVSSVTARATGDSVVFTFEYRSSKQRTLFLFDPPGAGVIGQYANAPANSQSVSITISKSKLRRVSSIMANLYPAVGDDFILLSLADIAALLVDGAPPTASGAGSEPALSSESSAPAVDIGFFVPNRSPDLTLSSAKARATTDSIVFTFGYESGQDRTLHLFDPPNGSIFMKTANAPASGRFVSVTISKVDLERVSEVTANFMADGTDVNGFVFLTFSDIAPLLGKSIASGQASGRASGQPDSAQYRTLLSAPGKLEIVRAPAPADFTGMQGKEKAGSLPAYNPGSNSTWQVDIRSCDLSSLDLAGRLNDLVHASFDSRTIWPARLPAGFDPAATMALGKNPGLGIRALHARGVTGRGVGIAIIDQALLTDHAEYGNRLKLYEEIHQMPSDAQMHAPAVASIAVGSSVGVAPEADLYFIAEWHAKANASGGFDFALEPLASAIDPPFCQQDPRDLHFTRHQRPDGRL